MTRLTLYLHLSDGLEKSSIADRKNGEKKASDNDEEKEIEKSIKDENGNNDRESHCATRFIIYISIRTRKNQS